ncbi:MAG: HNH endonuclease [Marinilabiliales bacterium]|nr:MAG: HNH endonuclease [Marinilabiliales bacterium]
MKEEMYKDEEWRVVKQKNVVDREKYKISNYGRVMSLKRNPKGQILKASLIEGYPCVSIATKKYKHSKLYVHQLVALAFIPKDPWRKYVIHLDFDKTNNHVDNLRWATKKERMLHQFYNPKWRANRKKITNAKLDIEKVKEIKTLLADPKRTMKLKEIAQQYGISEMQLYRIKRGENWGNVQPD